MALNWIFRVVIRKRAIVIMFSSLFLFLLSSEESRNKNILKSQYFLILIVKEMEQACKKALEQIRDRRYQEYLLNDDRRDIVFYGMAFCKKRCKVVVERGKMEEV